jgi:neutral ceramidase
VRMKRSLAFRTLLPAVVGVLIAGCCSSHEAELRVTQPDPTPFKPVDTLHAAVAEIDITPPPDLPFFGYSVAAGTAHGYWTRLYARVFVFQNGTGLGTGARLAVAQLDLGASSALLQRLVAAQLAPLGLTPADVVLLSTHTHGGPGGYFGSCFYNQLGAKRGGFDPRFTQWLATRIARAARTALENLEPARVAVGGVDLPNVSRNRSRKAWERNFQGPPPYDEVLPHLVVLRVDRETPAGSLPMGVLLFFPIHGTAVGPASTLYHGDLQAVAERLAGAGLERIYHVPRVVAGFADGPEGDVSPNWSCQGRPEALRLGRAIAQAATDLTKSLDGSLTSVKVARAYAEITIPGAPTEKGPVCDTGVIGMATPGGAADGHSFLYHLGFREGKVRRPPSGCQAEKKTAFGSLQRIIVRGEAFSSMAPLHAIQLGKLLTIVTVPGEPTTEIGRMIAGHVKEITGTDETVVAAHGNDYAGYITTAPEYSAQYYEGSSMFFGRNESFFFDEQLSKLARKLASGVTEFPSERKFRPGRVYHFLGDRPCDAKQWRPLKIHVEHDSRGKLAAVTFTWQGLREGHTCEELPGVRIECGGTPLQNPEGRIEDDDWLSFEAHRDGSSRWTATWRPDWTPPPSRHCRVRVERPSLPPLLSADFAIP